MVKILFVWKAIYNIVDWIQCSGASNVLAFGCANNCLNQSTRTDDVIIAPVGASRRTDVLIQICVFSGRSYDWS